MQEFLQVCSCPDELIEIITNSNFEYNKLVKEYQSKHNTTSNIKTDLLKSNLDEEINSYSVDSNKIHSGILFISFILNYIKNIGYVSPITLRIVIDNLIEYSCNTSDYLTNCINDNVIYSMLNNRNMRYTYVKYCIGYNPYDMDFDMCDKIENDAHIIEDKMHSIILSVIADVRNKHSDRVIKETQLF